MCSVGCHANKVYIFQNGMAVVAHHAKLLQLSLQTKITPAELGKSHCGLYDLWASADHIPRASPRVFHICWMAEALGEPLVDLGSNHFKNGWGTHNSLDRSPGMVLWDHLILRASAAMSLFGCKLASQGWSLQWKTYVLHCMILWLYVYIYI